MSNKTETNEMSDFAKVKALFDVLEIGYTATSGKEIIECMHGDANIKGYFGFSTAFIFDQDGKFLYMGASE